MVRPAVIHTGHCSGVTHLAAVSCANFYIVNEMPEVRARVPPGCFTLVLLVKECDG